MPYIPPSQSGASVPSGTIVMWSGTIATIPSGWFFCDGQNGTPNLRDCFVVGARQDSGGIAMTNIEETLLRTGGTLYHEHYVVAGEMFDMGMQEYAGLPGATSMDLIVPPYYALAYIMKG